MTLPAYRAAIYAAAKEAPPSIAGAASIVSARWKRAPKQTFGLSYDQSEEDDDRYDGTAAARRPQR